MRIYKVFLDGAGMRRIKQVLLCLPFDGFRDLSPEEGAKIPSALHKIPLVLIYI